MDIPPDSHDETRAARLERRRGWQRRVFIVGTIMVVIGGGAVASYALVWKTDTSPVGASAPPPSAAPAATHAPATTAKPTTTTTTLPGPSQPHDTTMPPPGNLSYGSRGPLVMLYEARMKELHFDPGPVDGVFDQDTQYAVIAVQKWANLPRTGVINTGVQWTLSHFRYAPAMPTAEPDRVEVDLDRQVITVFQNYQVTLITTTSTGSGEHFCGGADGCQYAITPTGHFHFYEFDRGWKKGKLGAMWNPFFFNGGIAIHGLASVPAYPASHGCARIPMHIANYFYTLVTKGESVYVVGTPKKAGNAYVGPIKTPPSTTTSTPPTTAPKTTPKTTVPKSPPTTASVKPTTPPTTNGKHP